MKQEEFDWLKLWVESILIYHKIQPESSIVGSIKKATVDFPPPIDDLENPRSQPELGFKTKKDIELEESQIDQVICSTCHKPTPECECPGRCRKCGGWKECFCEKDPTPKKDLICPDCETATIGIGREGACYQCILCKKRWDFDWEHPIVLNPQPNIFPTVPGMKEPKPDLKVSATARCNGHEMDFETDKDGDYYCPGCFPQGFAKIDKQDIEFFVLCKTFRDNPSKTEVICPCCEWPTETPK